MTIPDIIRGSAVKPDAGTPKVFHGPTAPAIEMKLKTAQGELVAFQAEHGETALDAELEVAGARDRLIALEKEISAKRATVETLRVARDAAIRRDEATIRAQRAALHKTQVAAVRKHLELRDAAATSLATALSEVVAQWKALIAQSEKAKAANPIGGQWPDNDGLCAFGSLKRLVGHEIYRLDGGDALLGAARAFPGALVDDLNNQGRPERIKPLVDVLKANSTTIIEALTGKPVT